MRPSSWGLLVAAVTPVLTFVSASHASEAPVGVAIVRAAPGSGSDGARDGAAEFEVLMRVAQLQRVHRATGLVCVGNRHGMLPPGGERALRRVVLSGVLVVRLAQGGEVAPTPDGLFLDGGRLEEVDAQRILVECVGRHGPPPTAADPECPTSHELTAIRAHLPPFQTALAAAAARRLAVR
jgi:hypothetical protein